MRGRPDDYRQEPTGKSTLIGCPCWQECQDITRKSTKSHLPDSVVTAGVRDTSRITFFRNITVDVLHEKIGCKDTVYEVSPDVRVVEVVLE